ncbi:MAG: hypothetical protein ACN4GW_13955 [Desulforhopalus sp.]
MQPQSSAGLSFIAWNGLQLKFPEEWDLRIGGHRNLIFEKEFQPQMQLRWETGGHSTFSSAEKSLPTLIGQFGTVMKAPPPAWRHLQQIFDHTTCYQGEHGAIGGGVCICPQCYKVISFQLLNSGPEVEAHTADCLASVSCHPDQQNLWRLQDFSLVTPPAFILTDYTFGAGLTRLSFRKDGLVLHTCKIAAADDRLRNQSLKEILLTLSDVEDLDITHYDDFVCQGYRRPSIPHQILLRMRRESPFIWGKIWHDSRNNRLLTVVLLAKRPIPEKTAAMICENYEIVIEKENS